MLKPLFNIPSAVPFVLACSASDESLAVADFYRRSGKNFTIAYFNNGTLQASLMGNHLYFFSVKPGERQISLIYGYANGNKPKEITIEEYWKTQRYSWLHKIALGRPIVTCHHLDDVCETYLHSAIQGDARIISPNTAYGFEKRERILKPFLTTKKSDMVDWCIKHGISRFENDFNTSSSNYNLQVKNGVIREALEINSKLHKVVKEKVIGYYKENPIALR